MEASFVIAFGCLFAAAAYLLMSRNLHQAVVQAIEDLPEREKLLLSLQFEHDLNQKEIAAVMGVTEGRISQLRSQAVARIRAKLKAE